MNPDLQILVRYPVPPFGVACPVCRHPLSGLPTDHCPECGERFELRELIEYALEHSQQARREAIRILTAHADPQCPISDDLVAFFAASDQYSLRQAVEATLRVARQRQAGETSSGKPGQTDADWEDRAKAAPPDQPFFTGFEFPVPDFGLLCSTCAYPLRGLTRRVCPECGTEFDPARILGDEPTLQACLVNSELEHAMAASALQARSVPHVLEPPDPLAQTFGVSLGRRRNVGRVMVPREFYFDALFWLRRGTETEPPPESTQESDADATDANSSPDWDCPQCSESVPGEFDMCWNCCGPRG